MTDSILNAKFRGSQHKPPPVTTTCKGNSSDFLTDLEQAAAEGAAHGPHSREHPGLHRAPAADLPGEDGIPIMLQKKAARWFSSLVMVKMCREAKILGS